ncbi:MAG: triose-phosphate isomerase [Oligoflexia bacterium]|nr:triose-phosphate isomerase [Oligoflexia bacterium]
MKTYIIGNWKMNHNIGEINNFFSFLNTEEQKKELARILRDENKEAWIAPQYIHIGMVKDLCASLNVNMRVGSQNSSTHEKGAFTGEVSAKALKDIGAHFVIVGHSERRSMFKEDYKMLKDKIALALSFNLKVVFCIGETLQEREEKRAVSVVRTQMEESLKGIDKSVFASEIILAYEPVWAIGTGKNATPDEAQEMHAAIRGILTNSLGIDPETAAILYGGSVSPTNISDLMKQKDINGVLVGGASLKPDDYLKLCQAQKR